MPANWVAVNQQGYENEGKKVSTNHVEANVRHAECMWSIVWLPSTRD